MLDFWRVLFLVFCPPRSRIDVSVSLLKQLLVRYAGRSLLLLAKWVVDIQENATAKPQLHVCSVRARGVFRFYRQGI
jgi:hypothetical protein